MNNLLVAHPHQQGITYLEHWCFAMHIARRLLASVVAFAVHAILPFIHIEPSLDLEATTAFLAERNAWIETSKRRVRAGEQTELSGADHVYAS